MRSDAQIRVRHSLLILAQYRMQTWIGVTIAHRRGEHVVLGADRSSGVPFTNWAAGQPDNAGGDENCVSIDSLNKGLWSDLPCSAQLRFWCQRTPNAIVFP